MRDTSYLEYAADYYRQAAETPQENLCCTTKTIWRLPDLAVTPLMLEMNYGCGTTVHFQDLGPEMTVL